MKTRQELETAARQIRLDIAKMTYHSGVKGAHLGGSMSMVEILAVLYGSVMKYDVCRPDWEERDRFILSKAHAAVGWYAALKYAGFLNEADIDGAMHGKSELYEHPKRAPERGIEFSGGSLGQGLSLGVGVALGLRKKGNHTSRVFVCLGDGECDEGAVWEAAASASHFGLNNLAVIIDINGLQYDGATADIMNLGDMAARWSSIGFDSEEVDGHDVMALQEALLAKHGRPCAICAKTVKGKGLSFAENVVDWHTGRLTLELYEQAVRELRECWK